MDADVKIDQALNELGMLSTTTNSRKEYLRERSQTKTSSSFHKYSNKDPFSSQVSGDSCDNPLWKESMSSCRPFNEPLPAKTNFNFSISPGKGIQIVHVNPQYVTDFSTDPVKGNIQSFSSGPGTSARDNWLVTNSGTGACNMSAAASSDCDMEDNVCAKQEALARFNISMTENTTPVLDPRAKDCFCQAYCNRSSLTKMPRSLLRKGRYSHKRKPYDFSSLFNKSFPEVEMRQVKKLECRSTSSSPMKGYKEYDGIMTRSRSLTHLEAAHTKLVDIFEETSDHENAVEIENVSNRIENLHFVERIDQP